MTQRARELISFSSWPIATLDEKIRARMPSASVSHMTMMPLTSGTRRMRPV